MILGNKCDLTESRAVSTESGKEVRREMEEGLGGREEWREENGLSVVALHVGLL